jgi:hypothetical protein
VIVLEIGIHLTGEDAPLIPGVDSGMGRLCYLLATAMVCPSGLHGVPPRFQSGSIGFILAVSRSRADKEDTRGARLEKGVLAVYLCFYGVCTPCSSMYRFNNKLSHM